MVSNYDRIFAEIQRRAQALGAEVEIDPEVLVALAMEVVDLEDQHRTKNLRINQEVRNKLQTAAGALARKDT